MKFLYLVLIAAILFFGVSYLLNNTINQWSANIQMRMFDTEDHKVYQDPQDPTMYWFKIPELNVGETVEIYIYHNKNGIPSWWEYPSPDWQYEESPSRFPLSIYGYELQESIYDIILCYGGRD